MVGIKGFLKGYIPWNKGKPRLYYSKGRLGKSHSEETKRKIGEANKISLLGHIPWNKGLKGYLAGEVHYNWKGNDASYRTKHHWIEVRLGQPKYCVQCGDMSNHRYHWANISGHYKRDVMDYVRLCPKCHKKFDRKVLG